MPTRVTQSRPARADSRGRSRATHATRHAALEPATRAGAARSRQCAGSRVRSPGRRPYVGEIRHGRLATGPARRRHRIGVILHVLLTASVPKRVGLGGNQRAVRRGGHITRIVIVSKTDENLQSRSYKSKRHKQKIQSQGSHAALCRFQFVPNRPPW